MDPQQIINQSVHAIREKKAFDFPEMKIVMLAGDASLRQYFRLRLAQEKSYVLMLVEPFRSSENNFLLIRDLLERSKVPCPKIIAEDESLGAILLEDLGDRTMLHELNATRDIASEKRLFQEALDLLVCFHKNMKKENAGPKSIVGFSQAFDEEKLMWEVDFTFEHLFKNYLRRNIPEQTADGMREVFRDICRRLEAEPRVFTHRDYHSRNIMLRESGEMVCIDFQDARMGLRQYDLASILRDSYYQLSDERVYELVDYYIREVKSQEGLALDRSHFITMFDLMSIQRNYKAIGSFTSFYARRGDASYLRFVGNTFENIRKNLMKFPEYKELLRDLYQYYYF